MVMKGPGAVLVLACLGAGPAQADWEYTKWGMTPQEVASASGDRTKQGANLRPDSDGNVTRLVGAHQSGKFLFEAHFGFDASDKLASVTLVLNDKSASMDMHMHGGDHMGGHDHMNMGQGVCHDLHVAVNATYGPPPYHGASHLYAIEKWQDQKNKNNVDYHKLYNVGCYVQYSVMKPSGAN